MPIRLHRDDVVNMNSQLVQALGFGPIGELHVLAGTSGNTYARLAKRSDRPLIDSSHMWATGPYAFHNAATTYENDVLAVAPDSHTWVGDSATANASLTWSKSCTHMIGLAPFSKGGGMRSRFTHSATMASYFTMSGHSNMFKNLYWIHGDAGTAAGNLQVGKVTGARNVYEQCHFAGPNDATQGATAGYNTFEEGGTQNYFKDCIFGGMNGVERAAANTILKLSNGQGTVYENCVFWSRTTSTTTPYFINHSAAGSTAAVSWIGIFLNCQFINVTSSGPLAYAITSTPGASQYMKMYFDNRCSFAGCTAIIAAADESLVIFGSAGSNPDSAAIGDDINLGLAQTYNYS